MTVITHARRKSNLAKMIDSAGGISVGKAVAQANANIDTMRAEAMLVLEAHVAALEAIQKPRTPDEVPDRLSEAYQAATGVIDAAGPFDLKYLCQAASGLCDLIDGARHGQSFDWRIVIVHAQSLRMLQNLPQDEFEARARIVDSLREVIERKLFQID
ncbi:MAG: hypothetical protein Q8M05_03950 [Rhodoferax sp.]|uniref:hypothetical protein n=1 Tax=Rhodoferax sp. TaxID=50421 RepID=UPI00272F4E0F|nr:hypothetical protein [Rhodoferax sp.]MDP1528516.1 hypothetical protein [Rhodoferax sp.]